MSTLFSAAAVGIAVGIVVGALGAGGGILAVPILVYLLGQEPHDAAAGSLIIVGLTAIVSLLSKLRHTTDIQWKSGLQFGLFSVLGSFAGARLAALLDANLLITCFALLLVGVSIAMFRQAKKQRLAHAQRAAQEGNTRTRPREQKVNPALVLVAALATGFLTGLFGVGGGFIVVPVLIFVLHFNVRQASATSLVVMIIASAAGLVSRIGTGVSVDVGVVFAFAAGSMLGGLIGPRLSARAKDYTLTYAFAVLLALTALGTLSQLALAG